MAVRTTLQADRKVTQVWAVSQADFERYYDQVIEKFVDCDVAPTAQMK